MARQRANATLADVANLAGVSLSTASKALNARAEVAALTRERVLKAAEELSFQPNALAQGLISGQTRTVGLLTDELMVARFAIPVLLGAENALGSEEMSVLLCDARGDAIRRRHYIRALTARRVDGFIVLGDGNEVRPSLSEEIPVPVVYVYCESDDPDDVSILADDAGGARLAAEHLISLGRRRIAHLSGDPSYRAAQDRATAFEQALDEAGLPLVGGSRFGQWSQRWGRQGVVGLLAAHPDVDAVFCGSDQIAYGVTEALRELGRDIPDDIAVVGYDNWEAFAAESRPSLTTVDVNLERLGAAAVGHLFAALDGNPSRGVVRQPCRLVLRESTGVARSR